uniref:angiopoietin-related protein 4 n=1 Tax=Euleptes europaea TaxID=460621 RepID=UPI002541DCAC|nr:angiopoietin-related protein 4 [Euleptes europaea]
MERWVLVVGAAWLAAASGGPRPGGQSASWDEVNVLAHGLLQLGHGLKEHVERTGGQLRALGGRLSAHNASLARLQRRLDGRVAQLAAQLPALLAQLAAHKAAVGQRLERLDGRLRRHGTHNGGGGGEELGALQDFVSRQNLRIEELFQKLKQQQYRMDKQNLQIKSLQSKVNMLLPMHIKENETQTPRWKNSVVRSADRAANHSQIARAWTLEASEFPTGCPQLYLEGERNSGVFQIQPPGSKSFEVFCDLASDSGGWTVIQRRRDGSVDFDQLWEAYRNGFGNMSGDFWLGLDKIHRIVREGMFRLVIEMQDWEGNSQLVQFLFRLGGEDTAYMLSLLGPVLGELENAMGDFPQLPFSTRDQDHDLKGDANCAKHLSGGWWFSTCGHVNLNGKYFRSIPRQRHERKQGIFWKTWKGRYYPLKSTTMKIQPLELGVES